jgi:hypothetical protein
LTAWVDVDEIVVDEENGDLTDGGAVEDGFSFDEFY